MSHCLISLRYTDIKTISTLATGRNQVTSNGTGNDNFLFSLSCSSVLLVGLVGDESSQTLVSPVLTLDYIVALKRFPTSIINACY